MFTLDNIVSDRGSKYAVSGAPCASEAEAKALLKTLRKQKKFAKATHNTWGLLLGSGPVKNDDGEAGAGNVILRMLERDGVRDHPVNIRVGRDLLITIRLRHLLKAELPGR